MPSTISEKAIAIINGAPKEGPLKDPTGFAEQLPDEAFALKHLLRSEEIAAISRAYNTADTRAREAQRWFRWLAWGSAYAGLGAAVLGGLLFYLSALSIGRLIENIVWAVQLACLGAALLGPLLLRRWNFSASWRKERMLAEAKRREFYQRLVAPGQPGAITDGLLLSLKLECFRRYLLDDQIDYFDRRGREQQKVAVGWSAGQILATILVCAAGVVPVLSLLEGMTWLPSLVQVVVKEIPHSGDIVRKFYWLLALIGGSLQGYFTLASSLEPVERNAKEYAAMSTSLTTYKSDYLNGVRTRAALADQGSVDSFTQLVVADLASEANDWDGWYPVRQEIALKLMAQSKIAPPSAG